MSRVDFFFMLVSILILGYQIWLVRKENASRKDVTSTAAVTFIISFVVLIIMFLVNGRVITCISLLLLFLGSACIGTWADKNLSIFNPNRITARPVGFGPENLVVTTAFCKLYNQFAKLPEDNAMLMRYEDKIHLILPGTSSGLDRIILASKNEKILREVILKDEEVKRREEIIAMVNGFLEFLMSDDARLKILRTPTADITFTVGVKEKTSST